MKRTLASLEGQPLEGLRAFVRVDFNVPLAAGRVADDARIRAAVPTIQWLRRRGSRVVLSSHLGRPKGQAKPEFSLEVIVPALETALGVPVTWIPNPCTADAVQVTKRLPRGGVALVENVRFWPGEEANDREFAQQMALLGDFYVNDAFGAAHRAHATTAAITEFLSPAVAGFLMAKELQYLAEALRDPARPFVSVLGGAKISGKIDVIDALLGRVDRILIGGAMACTFYLAQGFEVGDSLVEPDKADLATQLLERGGDKIMLPADVVIARELNASAQRRTTKPDRVEPGWRVGDIGSETVEQFGNVIAEARTVVWNGPMGVFEVPPFDNGTVGIAQALARATAAGATTIVGGGDSAAAVSRAGLSDQVSHVSTGGGASLELLEGKVLPGVAALDDV